MHRATAAPAGRRGQRSLPSVLTGRAPSNPPPQVLIADLGEYEARVFASHQFQAEQESRARDQRRGMQVRRLPPPTQLQALAPPLSAGTCPPPKYRPCGGASHCMSRG
eukprot:scaffold33318_cov67-Isochrysis_galbana.AAC.1